MSTNTSPGFRLWPIEVTRMSRTFTVTHTTQHMLAILKIRSEIEFRKYFAIKTTIFHYKVTIFTNHTSLTMNTS